MSNISQKAVKTLERICNSLGKQNDAVIAVATIAVFKATFRPIFTLKDEKQPKESRHYAALREFLTELIAIPSYLLISKFTKSAFAEKIAINKNNPENLKNVKNSLSFLGVCFTATFVIPYLCNLALTPIMQKFKEHQNLKNKNIIVSEPLQNSINLNQNNYLLQNQFLYNNNILMKNSNRNTFMENYMKTRCKSGMRVGN